jgi:hypothetical protein
LILRAGRLGWWFEVGTAEPFSWTMRNRIWDFRVRIPVDWIFELEKFLGLWTWGTGGCTSINFSPDVSWTIGT